MDQLGFASARDLLDVVVIPLLILLLGLAWPVLQGLRQRRRFGRLVYEEILESCPQNPEANGPWHAKLDKSLIHAEMITHPADTSVFILSLRPRFAYVINQLWRRYEAAVNGDDEAGAGVAWCKSLAEICRHLSAPWRFLPFFMPNRQRLDFICKQWAGVVIAAHPETHVHLYPILQHGCRYQAHSNRPAA